MGMDERKGRRKKGTREPLKRPLRKRPGKGGACKEGRTRTSVRAKEGPVIKGRRAGGGGGGTYEPAAVSQRWGGVQGRKFKDRGFSQSLALTQGRQEARQTMHLSAGRRARERSLHQATVVCSTKLFWSAECKRDARVSNADAHDPGQPRYTETRSMVSPAAVRLGSKDNDVRDAEERFCWIFVGLGLGMLRMAASAGKLKQASRASNTTHGMERINTAEATRR